jgi:hypothetical protein
MRLYRPSLPSYLPPPSAPTEPPPAPDLLSYNAQRLREDGRVLTLLGAACTVGATVGMLGALVPARVRTRAFFQAATGVHLFCLGTVAVGLGAVRKQQLPKLGLRTTLRRSGLLQRLLGLGLALDVASMTLGASLLRRRQRGRTSWREGAGASFLVHGLALLIFDAGVFWRNALHHRRVAERGRTSSGRVLVLPQA